MKKLLIVIQHIPYPLNTGGKKAQFDFIENLRNRMEITIIFVLKENEKGYLEKISQMWPNVKFVPFALKNPKLESLLSLPTKLGEILYQKIGEKILSLQTVTESDKLIAKNTMLFRSKGFVLPVRFIKHLKQTIATENFDFVQLEFHQLISLAKYIPKGIKKIFIHHELRYVREERELNLYSFQSNFLKRAFESNKKYELDSLKKFDLICTLSDTDLLELERYIASPNIYSSPIPVSLSKHDVSFKYDQKLVFLGGGDHFPNKEGFEWFLDQCWPGLKSVHPELKLCVVGKWTTTDVTKYTAQSSDIQFLGFVDVLSDVLLNGIVIVPIRIGSGVRIKIIDSVNIGAPFVSTSIGVEGLNFKHDLDCLIGDTATEFSSQITKIIEKKDLGEFLAKNAKKTLLEEYDYDFLIDKRQHMYHELNLNQTAFS
jgi:hypothetical protein